MNSKNNNIHYKLYNILDVDLYKYFCDQINWKVYIQCNNKLYVILYNQIQQKIHKNIKHESKFT